MSIEFIKCNNVKYYIVIILFLFIVVDKYRPFLCTHVNDTNDYINAIMIPVSWVIYYLKMKWISWSFYGRYHDSCGISMTQMTRDMFRLS